MSNLLSIESNFLSNEDVVRTLNLVEVRTIQRSLANGQKKKFEQTLQLSKLAVNISEWFASEDGQRKCAEEGIAWNNEEIGIKVFGWQKSFFYKVLKAGKLEEQVVTDFKSTCDSIERSGRECDRSLAGLLKYAKAIENGEAPSADGEGEDGESDAEASVTRTKTIFTLAYKPEGSKNVAIRISEDGEVVSTNDIEEIKNAIEFLLSKLS